MKQFILREEFFKISQTLFYKYCFTISLCGRIYLARARMCKHFRSSGIDSKKLIPPAYVARPAESIPGLLKCLQIRPWLHRLAESAPGIDSWAPETFTNSESAFLGPLFSTIVGTSYSAHNTLFLPLKINLMHR
jgi:hypothetical protein